MSTNDLWMCSTLEVEGMVLSQEHSERTVTTFFPFEALQTCEGLLGVPEEKVNSREGSSLKQCFQTAVWGPQGSGFEETLRKHQRKIKPPKFSAHWKCFRSPVGCFAVGFNA